MPDDLAEVAARPARQVPELADLMVSRYTGPVTQLRELPPHPWTPPGHRFAAGGRAIDAAHATVRTVTGLGQDARPDRARELACLEFAERLALFEPAPPLQPVAAPTGECPLSGQAMTAVDLATDRPAIRAAAEFFIHPPECPYSHVPGRPSSSGAAAGSSYQDALVRALLELLERDALMFAWRCGLRLRRIDVSAANAELGLAADSVSAAYLDLSFIHEVSTVLCVMRGTVGDRQVRGVGCAAKRTIHEAASHALSEAAGAFGMCAEHLAHIDQHYTDTCEAFTSFADNAYHYLSFGPMAVLDAVVDGALDAIGPHPSLQGDTATVLRALTGRLRDRQIMVFAADITPRWLRAIGVYVVVTRSPDLFPLELGPGRAEQAHHLLRHPSRKSFGNVSVNLAPVPLS